MLGIVKKQQGTQCNWSRMNQQESSRLTSKTQRIPNLVGIIGHYKNLHFTVSKIGSHWSILSTKVIKWDLALKRMVGRVKESTGTSQATIEIIQTRNHSGLGHGGNNGVMNVVGFWTYSESRLNVRDKREELRKIPAFGRSSWKDGVASIHTFGVLILAQFYIL